MAFSAGSAAQLPDVIPGCLVVPAIDLELDDAIHISGVSQQVLGQRIAQAMSVLKGVSMPSKPPIALKSVKVAREVKRNLGKVVVSFAKCIRSAFSKTGRRFYPGQSRADSRNCQD